MEHITLLILTKNSIDFDFSSIEYKILNNNVSIITDKSLLNGSTSITFDYLIVIGKELILNIDDLSLCQDKDQIITNYYQQSSIDHIYYINEVDINLYNKLERIYNHILYNE